MAAGRAQRLKKLAALVLAWLILGFTINAVLVVVGSRWPGGVRWNRYRNSAQPTEYGILLTQGWMCQHAQLVNPEPQFVNRLPSAPWWVDITTATSSGANQFAAGWPMRSATGYIRFGNASIVNEGLVRVPFVHTTHRGAPYLPLWRGLAVDVFVLGSPALLLCIPGYRAARRRRKGKCPRCGYDLKHDFASGCSECGWNKTATRHA